MALQTSPCHVCAGFAAARTGHGCPSSGSDAATSPAQTAAARANRLTVTGDMVVTHYSFTVRRLAREVTPRGPAE
jgi:hypothetical protein